MRRSVLLLSLGLLALPALAQVTFDANSIPTFGITWSSVISTVVGVVGGIFATFLGLFLGWKIILWAKRQIGRIGR